MLKVYFGWDKNRITDITAIKGYFDTRFKEQWFEDEKVIRFLKSFQNTEYIGGKLFRSDWFNPIAAVNIATGVQCAILLYKYQQSDSKFYPEFGYMGENCYNFIIDIADTQDVSIAFALDYVNFSRDFDFFCENDNTVYHTRKEFDDCIIKYMDWYGTCDG